VRCLVNGETDQLWKGRRLLLFQSDSRSSGLARWRPNLVQGEMNTQLDWPELKYIVPPTLLCKCLCTNNDPKNCSGCRDASACEQFEIRRETITAVKRLGAGAFGEV
jgi:hypothetical protein